MKIQGIFGTYKDILFLKLLKKILKSVIMFLKAPCSFKNIETLLALLCQWTVFE